ncbi:MAG: hypothetical protein OIF36_04880, partial [Alphaproteobacteria bacterium]|nr:hypothetical protein [Alphaproteobacteria bacterium]
DSYASFTTAPTGNSNVGGLVGYSSSGNVNNYSDLCEEGVNACSEADAIAIQNNSWTSPIWKTVGTTKTPLLIKE